MLICFLRGRMWARQGGPLYCRSKLRMQAKAKLKPGASLVQSEALFPETDPKSGKQRTSATCFNSSSNSQNTLKRTKLSNLGEPQASQQPPQSPSGPCIRGRQHSTASCVCVITLPAWPWILYSPRPGQVRLFFCDTGHPQCVPLGSPTPQ